MDKKQAIGSLKEALSEISKLKGLSFQERRFQLWFDKVKQIVKSVFSREDLITLLSTQLSIPVMDHLTPPEVKRDFYNRRLAEYGVNIEKIIQKYEILGIETEPTEPPIAPQDSKEQKPSMGFKLPHKEEND